jgi:hypothetical protein
MVVWCSMLVIAVISVVVVWWIIIIIQYGDGDTRSVEQGCENIV